MFILIVAFALATGQAAADSPPVPSTVAAPAGVDPDAACLAATMAAIYHFDQMAEKERADLAPARADFIRSLDFYTGAVSAKPGRWADLLRPAFKAVGALPATELQPLITACRDARDVRIQTMQSAAFPNK